ncbi:protein kinase [Phormidium sp. LEGE 05292]|uniref:protein kinase domain-containing protein n=1 Tax=[Phormidium] sp. LEGE 05292 TaxID=767427 RepID=UPI0018821289|nr:type IV pilin-like G/H family protein [Phormidium sp. LEGE 05292]MBE9228130.1 protein kinase [Phormidium sp. LEGE 05292]
MLCQEQILQNRYQLQELLGNHANRQTWLGVDLSTEPHQQVIIKLLSFSPQMQWEELKLFEREASVLKQLNHPKIPKYLNYFSLDKQAGDGLPWFGLVQEYIPGSSLQQLLNKGKLCTEIEAKDIANQLLDILIYLHELSPPVLHRDLKPSNIIYNQNKQIYLVDFGAVQEKAKAEGVTFTVVGTAGYAAPEQLWGGAIPASDLFSLGATLIHLLTGISPADLPQRKMRWQIPDKLSLSPSFSQWLSILTDPAIERRFNTASQAKTALNNGISSEKIADSDQQKNTEKLTTPFGFLVFLQLVAILASIGSMYYSFTYSFTVFTSCLSQCGKGKQAEGKQYVSSINKAQQDYYTENGTFVTESTPEAWASLGVGIKTQTTNYKYSISPIGKNGVNAFAIPLNENVKGYLGVVGLFGTNPRDKTSHSIVCETKKAGDPPMPGIVTATEVKCPSSMEALK